MLTKRDELILVELKHLIIGCLARDRICQRKLYDLYVGGMMGLCLRYCTSREEAEEVLQDGFVKMFKNINQFKSHGSFEGWLRRIMINCALQRYRTKINDFKIISLTDRDYLLSDNACSGSRMNEKELIRMIQTLPPAYRMVFNLHVIDGLKHKEIAALLNVTEGTSKSNLSDARKILKRHLTTEFKIIR